MILGPDKQKLSKRHGARSVVEYQEDGLLPEALVNCLVRLGWSHGDQELFTIEELKEFFDGSSLSASPSAFDIQKLQWFNAQILRAKPVDALAKLVRPFLPESLQNCDEALLQLCIPLYLERSQSLHDLAAGIAILLCDTASLVYDAGAVSKAVTEEGRKHIQAVCAVLTDLELFDAPTIEKAIQDYIATNELKFKQLGPPLRVALSGALGGPHLHEMIAVLGKENTRARMQGILTQS